MSIKSKAIIPLLNGIDYQLAGDPSQIIITSIEYNSNAVSKGTLFAALRGSNVDGHSYIQHAIDKGANVILAEEKQSLKQDVLQIIVKDSKEALAVISQAFYEHKSLPFHLYAVTGTNGKTTITWLLEAIADFHGIHSALMGTLGIHIHHNKSNSELTTPMNSDIHSLFHSAGKAQVDDFYMEASSIALEQKRLHAIEFDSVIFTNLSRDHLDFHGDMETYYQAKKKLFSQLKANGKANINIDDEYGKRLSEDLSNASVLRFSLSNPKADFYLSDLKIKSDEIRAIIKGFDKDLHIRAGITGKFNASNLLAAVIAFYHIHPEKRPDVLDLGYFKGAPGRLESFSTKNRGVFIVDFAHTPDAMKNIFLNVSKSDEAGKIKSIFGAGG
ncbi:UDP-N-acetylmuramoyl-L-alanyl-D-glutamate--2,6-diaminopimelate ligase, partial [bacterium]|nr:UDP-N-acetylmuramoyl-L-alanyl-D-glutamate--2,6-diaminopimelate ligase [bacterium]